MVNEDEIYLSMSRQDYRTSKSNILQSQIHLLSIIKRLNRLTILSKQKQDLKIKLKTLISTTLSDINAIETKIPKPGIPKIISRPEEISKPKIKTIIKEEKIEQKPIIIPEKKTTSKRDSIDEELRLIQEKLKALNNF